MSDDITSKINEMVARCALPEPDKRAAIREAAGLTQADLAKVLGTNTAAISRWESGERTPTGVRREQYAEALRAMKEVASGSGQTTTTGRRRTCPDCGKSVAVTKSGYLRGHQRPSGFSCTEYGAQQERFAEPKCGLPLRKAAERDGMYDLMKCSRKRGHGGTHGAEGGNEEDGWEPRPEEEGETWTSEPFHVAGQ